MSNYRNIVKGVREGDAQSQMMFYDIFIHAVYRSAYAIVGNENEAEEIAQDTLLKVFNKTELLHDDAESMKLIMRRIAINAAIDATRRRKNFILSSDELPDDPEDPEDDGEYDFSIEEIKEGIRLLPDAYQSVLTLRLFENVSFTEVANMLQINHSTARVQYTRGIAKLRNVLLKKKNYVGPVIRK
jgi:RNA polymerase sigma-70 factor (ECF subfamily)